MKSEPMQMFITYFSAGYAWPEGEKYVASQGWEPILPFISRLGGEKFAYLTGFAQIPGKCIVEGQITECTYPPELLKELQTELIPTAFILAR
jgi:hypothetical protein